MLKNPSIYSQNTVDAADRIVVAVKVMEGKIQRNIPDYIIISDSPTEFHFKRQTEETADQTD